MGSIVGGGSGLQIPSGAVVDTEYLSPEQHGGIYGTVYRQYFNITLPADLTSGDNVSKLIDFMVNVDGSSNRNVIRGWADNGTNKAAVRLNGLSGNSNLSIILAGDYIGNLSTGWVDYTK